MTHLNLQNQLQRDAYGIAYDSMNTDEKIAAIKDMVLALTDELHEALAEVGWKPWATSRHIHTEDFRGELIDAYHFLMNLMLIAGMTDEDVDRMYREKNRRNLERQQAGYDGVTGKCAACGRAGDDVVAHGGKMITFNRGTTQQGVICSDCFGGDALTRDRKRVDG